MEAPRTPAPETAAGEVRHEETAAAEMADAAARAEPAVDGAQQPGGEANADDVAAIPGDGGAAPAADAAAAVTVEPAPDFDLPYRVVFAVCTTDTVAVYDTGADAPVAFVSGLHYATITDAAWSPCGLKLVVSSSDGYCSALTFTEAELGRALAPEEVPEHIAHVLPQRRVKSAEEKARRAAEAAKAAAERSAAAQAAARVAQSAPARTEATAAAADGPKRIAPQAVTADGPKRIAPQAVTADGPERVMPTPAEPARRVVPVPTAEVGEKRPIDSVDGEAEGKKPQRIAPTPM